MFHSGMASVSQMFRKKEKGNIEIVRFIDAPEGILNPNATEVKVLFLSDTIENS